MVRRWWEGVKDPLIKMHHPTWDVARSRRDEVGRGEMVVGGRDSRRVELFEHFLPPRPYPQYDRTYSITSFIQYPGTIGTAPYVSTFLVVKLRPSHDRALRSSSLSPFDHPPVASGYASKDSNRSQYIAKLDHYPAHAFPSRRNPPRRRLVVVELLDFPSSSDPPSSPPT